MAAEHSPTSFGAACPPDFSFAFRDALFSDCTLRLHSDPHARESSRSSGPAASPSPHPKCRHCGCPSVAQDSMKNSGCASGQTGSSTATWQPGFNNDDAFQPTSVTGSTSVPVASSNVQTDVAADRILTSQPCSSSSSQSGPSITEVPVSTLILAAKSAYFKKMFTGSFRESLNRKFIDIYLPASEMAPFLLLLEAMYSGSIPPGSACSISEALQLMTLADRFEYMEGIHSSLAALQRQLADLEPPEALAILEAPESLQQIPCFSPVLQRARDCINDTYGKLVRDLQSALPRLQLQQSPEGQEPGQTRQQQEALQGQQAGTRAETLHRQQDWQQQQQQQSSRSVGLLELSEAAVVALLEAQFLEVDSEDMVVEAATAWVRHRHPLHSQQMEAVCRLVLPRVRLLSLSPAALESLCSIATEFLKASWRDQDQDQDQDPSPASSEGKEEGAGPLFPPPVFPVTGERVGPLSRDGLRAAAASAAVHAAVAEGTLKDLSNVAQSDPNAAALAPSDPDAAAGADGSASELRATKSESTRQPVQACAQATSRGDPGEHRRAGSSSGLLLPRRFQSRSLPDMARERPHSSSSTAAGSAETSHTLLRPSLIPMSILEEPGASSRRTSTAEAALEALANALVAFSERRLIERGAVPQGKNLSSCLVGVGVPRPRLSLEPAHAVVMVEVPWKRCRDWQPSNAFLATSSLVSVRGRWFTLNVQVCSGNSSLGLYLICDKGATFPRSGFTSFELEYRFCVQTAATLPAYQFMVKSKVLYTENQPGWGRANVLGKSWASFLQESDVYFPEGALRLRADLWIVEENGAQRSDVLCK